MEKRRLLRSMPRPVEALPCGSRSMISTCSPIAASAVPRLIAVVVLPTPPFWLAIAMTRGDAGPEMRLASAMTCGDSRAGWAGASAWSVMVLRPASSHFARESGGILGCCAAALHIPDHDNAAGRIDTARDERRVHGPSLHDGRLTRVCEFKLCILSLEEQAYCPPFPQKRKTLI